MVGSNIIARQLSRKLQDWLTKTSRFLLS